MNDSLSFAIVCLVLATLLLLSWVLALTPLGLQTLQWVPIWA